MTPSVHKEIEDIVSKSKKFAEQYVSGNIDLEKFKSNPHQLVAEHGITIPQKNVADFKTAINDLVEKHVSQAKEPGLLTSSGGCAACEIGLTVALYALIIMTVAAVVVAVVAFAPEVAGPAVLAFLESSTAVEIVLSIIITAAGTLAALLCVNVIKC